MVLTARIAKLEGLDYLPGPHARSQGADRRAACGAQRITDPRRLLDLTPTIIVWSASRTPDTTSGVSDVIQILAAIERGDVNAADKLLRAGI